MKRLPTQSKQSRRFHFRLSDSMENSLRELSRDTDIELSSIVRQLILIGLKTVKKTGTIEI